MTAPCDLLACPLDGAPLHLHSAQWGCEHGHRFDVASQGYVNLLPVQHKRSLDPGDSKDMVAARRRFLQGGHYEPIARMLCEHVQRIKTAPAPAVAVASWRCLDAGSGEGYYLEQLRAALGESGPVALVGLDISKWAVMAAAKRCKQSTWIVGTNAHLPIKDGSLDLILCLFGFPVHAEFARTLKPGARLLQIDAGAAHLQELRALIYDKDKAAGSTAPCAHPGFSQVSEAGLRYSLTLRTQQDIADLLVMTPHFFRATPAGRERAAALTELELTVDVRLTEFSVDKT